MFNVLFQKTLLTIVHPCITPILFIRTPILLSDLLLPGYMTSWESNGINVAERVVLLIYTTKMY